jgi:hypothetical protein
MITFFGSMFATAGAIGLLVSGWLWYDSKLKSAAVFCAAAIAYSFGVLAIAWPFLPPTA